MKKKHLFYGAATALITPFSGGKISYEAFSNLIDFQLEEGIDALVVGGTTGEAATLSDTERYSLFEFAAKKVSGRVPLIFGTGTNDTRGAIAHTKAAKELGADGALVVTPYYNKGTKDGIIRHYSAIAESCDIPIILYNVPSRTGVDLSMGVLEELRKIPNAVGIKEASDSTEKLVSLADFGESLPLYAGNDSAAYTVLSLGGAGVISVISNFLPRAVSEICRCYSEGKTKEALTVQLALLPLIKAIFTETNPTPIKYLLSRSWEGFKSPVLPAEIRLPLSEATLETKGVIERELNRLKDLNLYLFYNKY